jgi:hypothetical protein
MADATGRPTVFARISIVNRDNRVVVRLVGRSRRRRGEEVAKKSGLSNKISFATSVQFERPWQSCLKRRGRDFVLATLSRGQEGDGQQAGICRPSAGAAPL